MSYCNECVFDSIVIDEENIREIEIFRDQLIDVLLQNDKFDLQGRDPEKFKQILRENFPDDLISDFMDYAKEEKIPMNSIVQKAFCPAHYSEIMKRASLKYRLRFYNIV